MKSVIGKFLLAVWMMTLLAACGGGGAGTETDGPVTNPSGVVTTIAGPVGGQGYSDGTGASVHFGYPRGITTDGTSLYVADTFNHTIRKIVIATGVVSTLAGSAGVLGSADGTGDSARFHSPHGITTDGANLYVADTYNHTIRRIVIATGVVSTLAGSARVDGSDDGTGAFARFNNPCGITTDGTNLFVADTQNSTIRKIVIGTGVVSTLAGSAGADGSNDGTGSFARFYGPYGITTDGTNLYVSDTYNNTIRKIVIDTSEVSTLAGSAGVYDSDDGTGTAARFRYPYGIITDGANLFIADSENHTIRKIVIATGVVSTLAGSARVDGSADGTGSSARFYGPCGITTDGRNLYVADSGNITIRKIVTGNGVVTTLAGSAVVPGLADGSGYSVRFSYPHGITTDGRNLYVADSSNHTIRKIVIGTGVVSTLAGSAGVAGSVDGSGASARFEFPLGITTDGTNLYVSDSINYTIRKIVIGTGEVSTLAGSAGVFGSNDGAGASALFGYPRGITTDGTNLYVADEGNNTIRKIVIGTGVVTTLAGSAEVNGADDGAGSSALFKRPSGITTDGTNLYVADTYNHTIRKIVIATGLVSTLAGSPGVSGSVDGTGGAALFGYPHGITTDGTNLYVADTYNHTIRKIVISTGVVSTLAGSAPLFGTDDGTSTDARFCYASGITNYGANLYVADTENHRIRKVTK